MATRTIADGGGTWSSLGTWVEGVVPTASDAVVATGTSGQLTVDTGAVCLSADFTNYTNTLTINISAAWTISTVAAGSALKLVAGMTVSAGASSAITFNGAPGGAATVTITTAGKSVPGITVNGGANLTVQLADAFTTAGTITLTAAKLDTNNQTVSASNFSSSNSNTRTLLLGSSGITLTLAGSAWTTSTVTGLTFTPGTSTITFSASVSNFNSGGLTYNNVVWTSLANSTPSFIAAATAANLTANGSAAKTNGLSLGGTITITGTLTIAGNSSINRILVSSSVLGTARSLVNNGTNTLSNVDFQDTTASGTASWNLSAATGGSGDALGNTGITFTPAATQFWFSGIGNWSDSTKWFLATAGGGGAGRVPLPQDNVRFDASSFTAGSQVVTMDMPRGSKDLDFTGVINSPKLFNSSGNPSFYGSVTLPSAGLVANSGNAFFLSGRSSHTFTSNGQSFGGLAIGNNPGGTYTLQDSFNAGSNSLLNVTGTATSTFTANNQSVTMGGLQCSGTSSVINMGSGSWTLNGTTVNGNQIWKAFAGPVLNVSTAVVSCAGVPGGATTSTVTTAAISMPNFTVNGGTNLTVQFSDAFTTTGTVTLTAGKLDTNGQTCSWSNFSSSNTNTRTLTLGSSPISLSIATGTVSWFGSTTTGLTVTATTAIVTSTGASGGFSLGSFNWNGLSFVAQGAFNGNTSIVGSGTPTIANLTITGTAIKTNIYQFAGTPTMTGTFTASGNSTTNRSFLTSSTLGTSRILTAAAIALTNVDFQDITGAGLAANAAWTGTSMGDALGNTNITFDAPVTRYGVVAGNWSSTATWSNASGGAGGFSVPLPQDNVILDASSGAGTYTADMPRLGANLTMTGFTRTAAFTSTSNTMFGNLTLAAGMTLTSGSTFMTFAGRGSQTLTSAGKSLPGNAAFAAFGGTYTLQDAFSETGGTFFASNGTFAANGQTVTAVQFSSGSSNTRTVTMGSGTWTLTGGGSVAVWTTNSSGLTLTITGSAVVFTGTSGVNTITTAGLTMPATVFNGVGGTWQFQDAYTASGQTITLTNGTLDMNSKAVTSAFIASTNSNVRTMTLGSSAVTLTGGAGAWDTTTSTNMTLTANTATITFSGTGASMQPSSLTTYNNLVFSGSGNPGMSGSCTCANLTRTGTAVKTDTFFVSTAVTVSSAATFTGNSITNRVLVQSGTLGTAATITVNSTRAHSNVDFMDITGAGAASTDLSAITGGSGDCGGNSGYTFTPAQTNYWRSASSAMDDPNNWASTSTGAGGSGRVPLPQDTARFDANSSTGQNVNFRMPRIGTLDFTGWTGTTILSNAVTFTIFGNLVMPSGGTITGWNSTQTFGGRGSQTITMNGRTASFNPTFQAPNGTYTLQDAASMSTVTHNNGTLAGNSQSLTLLNFVSTGAAVRAVSFGSGTWSHTSTSGFWNVVSTLTVTAGTGTLISSAASASTRNFNGGGLTYNNVSYTVAASTGPLVITGANTFTNLTVTSEAGNAKTLTLPSATTTTITGARTLTGTVASPLVINSSISGSTATLLSTLGGTDNTNDGFVTLTDITEVIRRATVNAAGATPSTSLSTHTTVCSSPAGSLSNPSPISPHINTCRAPGGSISTITSVHDHSTTCSSPAGSLSRSATNLHFAIRTASPLAGSLSSTPTITKKALNLASRVFAGSIPTDIAAKQVSVLALLPSGGLMRDTEYQLVFIPKGREGTILNSHRTRAVVV